MGMEFTRHARNRMRHLGITEHDIERIITEPAISDTDPDGRPRHIGHAANGTRVRVVLAADTPNLVVTVHESRR